MQLLPRPPPRPRPGPRPRRRRVGDPPPAQLPRSCRRHGAPLRDLGEAVGVGAEAGGGRGRGRGYHLHVAAVHLQAVQPPETVGKRGLDIYYNIYLNIHG